MHKILLIHILLLICTLGYSQNVMEKVIEIPWNTEEGCKMEQFPEGNYGIPSYQVINENELAVLCVVHNWRVNVKE